MSTKVRRIVQVLVCAILCYALTGCTVAHITEFKAYRGAFDEARRAGEEVLFSYAAARDKVLPPGTPQPAPARSDGLPARTGTANVDEVTEFMAGWDAVAAYNEFVAAIIEGKEESEVQALYGGYQSIVASLPKKTAEAIAKATGPWSSVIDQAIKLLDQESRRRRFVQMLKEGGSTVQAILALHAESASLMFNAQYLANEREYVSVANHFRATTKHLKALLVAHTFDKEQDIIADIKRSISTFPADGGDTEFYDTEPVGSPAADSAAVTRLEGLRRELNENHAAAISLTVKLNDHRRLLAHFRDLVYATQEKLRQAVIAAASGKQQLPDITDVRQLVIEVRKALILKNERS